MTLPAPTHLSLGEVIARLEKEPPDKVIGVGFHEPCSYRGYYNDLAFIVTGPMPVGHLLAAARSALGTTYCGWKGGEYQMNDYTSCWLVGHRGDTGESLGAMLLDFLLANEVV